MLVVRVSMAEWLQRSNFATTLVPQLPQQAAFFHSPASNVRHPTIALPTICPTTPPLLSC